MEQNKYQRGVIYAIRSHHTDDVYLGSTTQPLHKRLHQHKHSAKYMTSAEILKYGDGYIDLVENFPCNSKAELNKRESWYIRHSDCVNKRIEGRTKEEWYEENKEKISENGKTYYTENKETILERNAIYHDANKESILKQNKIRYEANKDIILEKKKEYHQNNKESILEKKKAHYEANKAIYAERNKAYKEKKKAQSKSGSVALE